MINDIRNYWPPPLAHWIYFGVVGTFLVKRRLDGYTKQEYAQWASEGWIDFWPTPTLAMLTFLAVMMIVMHHQFKRLIKNLNRI